MLIKMKMLKLNFKSLLELILFLLLLNCKTDLLADNFWYISPGIRIGWNHGGNFAIDGKISIGINTDDTLNKITFYNITLGFNALSTKGNENQFKEYNYIQFQTGSNFIEDNMLTAGIGAGFIFNTDSKNDFSPIIRLFSGFIIFPELDLIILHESQIWWSYGIRGIVPIPLQRTKPLFD